MLDLWLVRHAESFGNLDGSASDSGLTPTGMLQAAALTRGLSCGAFREVLCSPLLRARETAAHALPSVPVVTVTALRELESSRRPTYVDPTDPAALASLLQAPVESTESGAAFMARVAAWIDTLPGSGTVLAVAHFAVIREVLGALLGFRHAPQRIDFTAIFRVRLDAGRCDVLTWNDTRHTNDSTRGRR